MLSFRLARRRAFAPQSASPRWRRLGRGDGRARSCPGLRSLEAGWTLDGPGSTASPPRCPARSRARWPLPACRSPTTSTSTSGPSLQLPVARRQRSGRLCLDGLATLAEVELGGEPCVWSGSMWQAHAPEVRARSPARTAERAPAALRPARSGARAAPRRPRARWRTRLVANAAALAPHDAAGPGPGFAPGPAGSARGGRCASSCATGPAARGCRCALAGEATTGLLAVAGSRAAAPAARLEIVLDGPSATGRARRRLGARARMPGVAPLVAAHPRRPALHDVRLLRGRAAGPARRRHRRARPCDGSASAPSATAAPRPTRDRAESLDLHCQRRPGLRAGRGVDARRPRRPRHRAPTLGLNLVRVAASRPTSPTRSTPCATSSGCWSGRTSCSRPSTTRWATRTSPRWSSARCAS